ncbi:MAG: type VI secretion system tube protein Hcp [Alphaproteobacteria bacterium]|nr:type VI secretion system tube protein Hcp [Alphaproteobacteria bacterium]
MPIYMNVNGISGSTTAAGYEGWITIDSVQWSSNRPISTTGEVSKRAKAALSMAEVVVTKQGDGSSGHLWQEHLKAGTSDGKTVEFHWVSTGSISEKSQTVFQKMKLENALISSFATSSRSDERTVEILSFNFTKIECTYQEMEKVGTKTSKPFVASFDLSKD